MSGSSVIRNATALDYSHSSALNVVGEDAALADAMSASEHDVVLGRRYGKDVKQLVGVDVDCHFSWDSTDSSLATILSGLNFFEVFETLNQLIPYRDGCFVKY